MGNVKAPLWFVNLLRRCAIASPQFCEEREGVEAEHWHFATIWKHFQRHLLLFFYVYSSIRIWGVWDLNKASAAAYGFFCIGLRYFAAEAY